MEKAMCCRLSQMWGLGSEKSLPRQQEVSKESLAQAHRSEGQAGGHMSAGWSMSLWAAPIRRSKLQKVVTKSPRSS